MRLIKFNEKVEGPELHIGLGSFNASFFREKQPFAVSEADWEILKTTRNFEVDVEAEAAKQAAKPKDGK